MQSLARQEEESNSYIRTDLEVKQYTLTLRKTTALTRVTDIFQKESNLLLHSIS